MKAHYNVACDSIVYVYLNKSVMMTFFMAAVILKDAHYILYYLTPAIQPRMLVTFNEELSPLSVNVRVGQVRERERERERERGSVYQN